MYFPFHFLSNSLTFLGENLHVIYLCMEWGHTGIQCDYCSMGSCLILSGLTLSHQTPTLCCTFLSSHSVYYTSLIHISHDSEVRVLTGYCAPELCSFIPSWCVVALHCQKVCRKERIINTIIRHPLSFKNEIPIFGFLTFV